MSAATSCTGTPVSWLRLEQFALDPRDPAVRAHVDSCAACRDCLGEIERDIVALPPLAVPERRRRSLAWLGWLAAPLALAAAVALVIILRPAPHDAATVTIKGVGDVTIGLVRERAGTLSFDARRFAPGDRWKVVVTCPPQAGAWIDVAVIEAGAAAPDFPLAPARVACGNHVVVPGAFELTGARRNRVCALVRADQAPARALGRDMACVAVDPDRP